MIENPAQGALYMSLFYMIGIPLSFPNSFLVFFGTYAATHVFGFYSNSHSLTYFRGPYHYIFVQYDFCTPWTPVRLSHRTLLPQRFLQVTLDFNDWSIGNWQKKALTLRESTEFAGSTVLTWPFCSDARQSSLTTSSVTWWVWHTVSYNNYEEPPCIVRLRDYVLGNNGMLLSSLIYLYLGASASEIVQLFTSDDADLKSFKATVLIAGGCMLILILAGLGWLTKREIDKMILEE